MKSLLQELNKKKIDFVLNPNFKDFSYLRLNHQLFLLIKPKSIKKLIKAIKLLKKYKIAYAFIGNGTNSFIIDNNIALISLMYLKKINHACLKKIKISSNQIMSYLSSFYSKKRIKTFIGGTLIPGTIGAGIIGNAGIKNITVAKYLQSIIVLDLNDLKIKRIKKKDISFKYRFSNLNDKIILKLSFFKSKDNDVLLFYDSLAQYRKNQPKERSLGSTFKNHSLISAGALIDSLGLKGIKYQNLEISTLHANFIISKGNAFSIDFYFLILLIKICVYFQTGILLEQEVKKLKKYL